MKTSILFALFAAAAGVNGLKAIPGQYIVQFKKGVEVAPHMRNLQRVMEIDSPANEIFHQYHIGDFKGYAIRCTPRVLSFIKEAVDFIEVVEEDQVMAAFGVQNNPPSWGQDRVSQRNLPLDNAYHYPDTAGSGVDMYTIDTGIYIQHNDYAGRAVWGFTAASGASDEDKNGHGTHCSGTMAGTSYGLAKKANLIAVKVLGDLGFGTTADVISGVNWVANQHNSSKKSVGNMSLGGGAATTLDSAVNAAVDAGVHMAVAAGNDNANACNYSPARADKVVCVGSTDNADRKSSFSNHGSCVEIHAPGTSITSSWIGGTSAERTISGTSMASPHVAGVMALYLGAGKVPSIANLQAAATQNVITGLPSGTVNYLLYSDANLAAEYIPEIQI